jgi:uncharacterized protein with FMN-binding domain
MRKYIQITIVAGLFGLLVLYRESQGSNAQPVVIPPTSSSSSNTSSLTPTNPASQRTGAVGVYKDGTYTGSVADAFYGNIQVQAVIAGGKITDVVFVQYPNDNPTSISVNTQAIPFLKQEALSAQSSHVDIVSGASDSSEAFQQSLASALSQALTGQAK